MKKKQRIAELEALVDTLKQEVGRLEQRLYMLEARTPAQPFPCPIQPDWTWRPNLEPSYWTGDPVPCAPTTTGESVTA